MSAHLIPVPADAAKTVSVHKRTAAVNAAKTVPANAQKTAVVNVPNKRAAANAVL